MVSQWNIKLAPHYYAPFQVTHAMGSMVYQLNLHEGAKIHHNFHVSRLKKKLGPKIQPFAHLPPTNELSEVLSELEVIES